MFYILKLRPKKSTSKTYYFWGSLHNDSKTEIIKEINFLNNSLAEYTSKLNGKPSDVFKKESEEELAKLKMQLNSILHQNEELKKSIASQKIEFEIIENKFKNETEVYTKLNNNSNYIKTVDFFKSNYPEQKISEEIITDEIVSLNIRLNQNIEREEILKNEIETLDSTLNAYTKKGLEEQRDLLVLMKDSVIKIITSFEQSIRTRLNIEVGELDFQALTKVLNGYKQTSTDDIAKYDSIIKNYALLSQFKNNVTPYLKYEKAKIKEEDIKRRTEFLRAKVSKVLEDEKNKVSEHLTQQIHSFFYEGLINDLYKRIDPHPDYKNVAFKCDFSDPKPKLNVCLFQTCKDELIIPNLYFSTAQLNILSLSIFLAKALNAKNDEGKPLNCIFIDDPIQSMDSINILSTIDLIRSIIVNQKKQIILSTHDENFHNLLKKKMPTNLFNSKYMELETFGKVKQYTS